MEPIMNAQLPSHRPVVPPKPDKDKISSPLSSSGSSVITEEVQFPISPESRKISVNGTHEEHSPALPTSPKPLSHKPPISPQKPVLPPKPKSTSSIPSPSRVSTSPANPTTTTPPPPTVSNNANLPIGRNSISIANSILANRNRSSEGPNDINSNTHPPTSLITSPNARKSENSSEDFPNKSGVILRHDYRAPSAPLSPRPTFNATPRPFSSIFGFPSDQNQNQPRSAPSGPIGQRHSEILRGKSASLGRDCAPPTSSGGFFSNKAASLARMLPLDLHFGKSTSPKSPKSPPPQNLKKSATTINANINQNRFNFNPPQPSQNIQNLGRNISFSGNSPIPPPPPPRLKKKLSPVNSLSPVESPNSPPPIFPPVASMIPPVVEEQESAIYAEIDKEKKWAARKLKEEKSKSVNEVSIISVDRVDSTAIYSEPEEGIQGSLRITINRDTAQSKTVNVKAKTMIFGSKDPTPPPTYKEGAKNEQESKPSQMENNNVEEIANVVNQSQKIDTEGVIVDSWLGKYLKNPVIPSENTFQTQNDNKMSSNVNDIISGAGEPNRDRKSSILLEISDNRAIRDEGELKIHNEDELADNKSFLFAHLDNPTNVQFMQDGEFETKREEIIQEIENHASEKTEVNHNQSSVNRRESESFPDAVKDENENTTTNLTADTIVQSIDTKIQSVVTLLSNLSGKVSPSQSQKSDSPSPPTILPESVASLSITESNEKAVEAPPNSGTIHSAISSPSIITTPPATSGEGIKHHERSLPGESSVIRRYSWNCSGDSSSPCDSSSSSLTNIRDRCFTYSNGNKALCWVDEGDSTGVLADAESSDAPVPTSSTEDMGAAGSSLTGRRKFMRIFSSFGKPGSSSSSSSNGNGIQKAPKRQKDKEKTKILAEANGKLSGGRISRQISDIVVSSSFISGPLISHPVEREKSHPAVQFSPDVIDHSSSSRYRYSEGYASNPSESPLAPPSEDTESIHSFSSVSTTSTPNLNMSGYEDILAELSQNERKAFFVAREILTSEQTFCDVLNILTVEFPHHIRYVEQELRHPIIPPHDLDTILAGLPNLKRVNEELKVDLQERVSNWLEKPKLADVIVKKGPFLKLYAHYIKNFEKTTQKLDECCQQNPSFAKALLEFEMNDRCQKLGLKHYMLKPVQRMPQYRLLLEDYLKYLEKDGCDYDDTVRAIGIVKDVAEHANEAIKLQVNAEKLMQLQNRLVGSIIMKSDRQLLKEGELQKVCRKVLQARFFALMNDCLLYMDYVVGSGMNKDLKLRNELPLAGMRVCLTQTEDYPFEFSVISVARSFNLVAKSAKERDEWMKALSNAIHDNIKKRTCSTPDQEEGFQLGKVAPVWIQDSRVTMCQICTAEFTVTFRRHHCRSCGKVVCGHCSGNQAPLQYLKNDAARVCDECYQFLLEEFDKDARDCITEEGLETSRDMLRMKFKKVTPNVSKRAAKLKRTVPSRLEVHANNSGSRISGYLHLKERKAWKRSWFVLMDRVLYIYAASEDIVAVRSIPVLGWTVTPEKSESMDGSESQSVFKLTHSGQNTLLFQAENPALAERWMSAMTEAVVLS